MQEIYRSRSLSSLVLKKQYLEEYDIPCHIFLEGTDITAMPEHPYGLSYHLEECAALVVADEDEQKAWNLLNNIENPVGEDDEDLEDDYEEDPESPYGAEAAYGVTRSQAARRPGQIAKYFFALFFIAFSIVWLYFAYIFLSALWLERPGSRDWQEDAVFIPIGGVMILLWLISLVFAAIGIVRRHRK